MSILTDWDYHLDVDGVLKGQSADPAVIRKRSPRLVEIAVGFTVYCAVIVLLRDSFMTDLLMGKVLKKKRSS